MRVAEPTACLSADSDFHEQFETAHDAWSRALASPELKAVGRALAAAAIDVGECVREAATITELPATRHRLVMIRRTVAQSMGGVAKGAFERFVLGHTVLRYKSALQSAPVSAAVKRLTSGGLARFADGCTVVDLAENRFAALCKMATRRRFAAG